ncbi:hypothetical protein XPA_006753 [Xanthoria parietina]
MGSAGLKAPLYRQGRDRQLLVVRILQLLFNVAYIVTIAMTSADSGRWTYESIEIATKLGATAATLTFVNFAVYLTRFDPVIHRAAGPGRIKRLACLVIRIIIDLFIGALWCAAFAASFHRKTTNFQKLFASPPYKTWAPAVVFTLIEWWVSRRPPCNRLRTHRSIQWLTLRERFHHPGEVPLNASSTCSYRDYGRWRL